MRVRRAWREVAWLAVVLIGNRCRARRAVDARQMCMLIRSRSPGGTHMASDAKYVYDFAEGNKDLKDLLGGKGANLAEMTNLGLPVPPGFVITTEACREYLNKGSAPAELEAQV